jgi:hypothetical protein
MQQSSIVVDPRVYMYHGSSTAFYIIRIVAQHTLELEQAILLSSQTTINSLQSELKYLSFQTNDLPSRQLTYHLVA